MSQPEPGFYESLFSELASHTDDEVTLTFAELERLLGAPLPQGAWLRAWWTNAPDRPQARAWLAAGWRVHWVRRIGTQAAVTFTRPSAPARRLP